MRSRAHLGVTILAGLALGLALAGCASHEKRMTRRVDALLEAGQHRRALDYLERYLDRHVQSLKAWEYRVRIRLDIDQRAHAGAEYWRLQKAMGRQHPEVLRQVVLGRGADWIVDDYAILARCGPDDLGDAAFFIAAVEGTPVREGSNLVHTPRPEAVIGVMDAMPGRLGADAAPVIALGLDHEVDDVRSAAAAAAVRLLASGAPEGDALLRRALDDRSPAVRRAALESLGTPWGPADPCRYRMSPDERDEAVAIAWLGLCGTGEGEDAAAVRETVARAGVVAAALAGARPGGSATRPLSTLAAALDDGPSGAALWSAAPEAQRRELMTLVAPVLPLPPALSAAVLTDADAVVRTAAARYLERGVGDGALLPLLRDPAPGVRLAAAKALVSSGDPQALPHLEPLFSNAGFEEKLAMLEAMHSLTSNPFVALARTALADDRPLVREFAITPLAATCSDDNRAIMLDALTDDDAHVVVRASTALYITLLDMPEESWVNPPPAPPPAPEDTGEAGGGG